MASFSKRFNAQRAARRELKNEAAVDGVEFRTDRLPDGGFSYTINQPAAPSQAPAKHGDYPAPKAYDPAADVAAAKAAVAAKRKAAAAPKADEKRGPHDMAEYQANQLARHFYERPADKPAKAAKAGKPAKADKPAKAPKPPKVEAVKYSKRATVEQAAARGILPSAPNFMAETHARYRKKLAAIVAMVEAGDVAQLESLSIPLYSSSPRAMARYRDLAVVALKAQAANKADGRLLTDISVDENEARIIANAESYSAVKAKGRGKYDRKDAATLGEARKLAEAMGPGAMIYAITPEGRSTLVETVPHK